MSGYRGYYLWCPNWDPGTPPPIHDQVYAHSNGHIYSGRAWTPPMCRFENDAGERFGQGHYLRSSDEMARHIRDTYRCTEHGNAPEVFRQQAAYDRRYSERRDRAGIAISLRTHPELIPEGFSISEYSYISVTIPRRPDPVTTHTTWATS